MPQEQLKSAIHVCQQRVCLYPILGQHCLPRDSGHLLLMSRHLRLRYYFKPSHCCQRKRRQRLQHDFVPERLQIVNRYKYCSPCRYRDSPSRISGHPNSQSLLYGCPSSAQVGPSRHLQEWLLPAITVTYAVTLRNVTQSQI